MGSGVGALSTCADFIFEQLPEISGIAPDRIFLPVQTHTARVVRVPASAPELQEVDGVVSAERGTLIGVRTADCLPLLMADTDAGVIAAIHCGWRGTVGGIALRGAREMIAAGADPARIRAIIGPHICAECFEVGEEVAELFPEEAVIRRPNRKPHVSLARAVELQLAEAGVTRVSRSGLCSMEDVRFHSVRRQGRDWPLRTVSAIWLRS